MDNSLQHFQVVCQRSEEVTIPRAVNTNGYMAWSAYINEQLKVLKKQTNTLDIIFWLF